MPPHFRPIPSSPGSSDSCAIPVLDNSFPSGERWMATPTVMFDYVWIMPRRQSANAQSCLISHAFQDLSHGDYGRLTDLTGIRNLHLWAARIIGTIIGADVCVKRMVRFCSPRLPIWSVEQTLIRSAVDSAGECVCLFADPRVWRSLGAYATLCAIRIAEDMSIAVALCRC
ncbi:hypothetical protein BU25DRAFT_448725 [Macroventuria anomochaeta]|uniref:Uncharacterized protein n=1 Tax=Macroventuria anomochaeta TaxID=301207 RepID=A0ACB6S0C8_9PLEO|nr:uncharacterized protein BU25DRAFT_448725 [Macroventuria anomochaeta]KAF2627403.1 hypothetical protein BU25DRAFT_448725 [Macroventuria anomochaeta]